jgi:hypothetical protein
MPTYHYAVTVSLNEGDDLGPALFMPLFMPDALADRAEYVEFEPLSEDDD